MIIGWGLEDYRRFCLNTNFYKLSTNTNFHEYEFIQVGRWPPRHVLPKKTNTDSRLLLNLKKKRIIGDKIALLYLFYLCSFPNLGGRGTEATVLLGGRNV